MKRVPLAALAALALLSLSLVVTHRSGASFTAATTVEVSASADSIENWLHIQTASTGTGPAAGYFSAEGTTNPAACGSDETAAVDMGSWTAASTPATAAALFCLTTPATFPAGITKVTVTVSALPDPASGCQPVRSVGIAAIGDPALGHGRMQLAPGDKAQVNVLLDLTGSVPGTVYEPALLVTLTYEGMDAVYYQYKVPVSIAVPSGNAP